MQFYRQYVNVKNYLCEKESRTGIQTHRHEFPPKITKPLRSCPIYKRLYCDYFLSLLRSDRRAVELGLGRCGVETNPELDLDAESETRPIGTLTTFGFQQMALSMSSLVDGDEGSCWPKW